MAEEDKILTLAQATELAVRIRAEIPLEDRLGAWRHYHHARKRLAADLQAIRDGHDDMGAGEGDGGVTLLRYASASLLRTAKEYGVRRP